MEVLPILSQQMIMSENIWVSLTLASTLYKIRCQCTGVPFIELINENALSLAKNVSTVLLKLFRTIPAVSVPDLILSKAKFIDERNGYAHTQIWQRHNLFLMQSTD